MLVKRKTYGSKRLSLVKILNAWNRLLKLLLVKMSLLKVIQELKGDLEKSSIHIILQCQESVKYPFIKYHF